MENEKNEILTPKQKIVKEDNLKNLNKDREINLLFINPSSMPAREQEDFLNRTSILRLPDFSMPIGLLDLAAYLRKHVDSINIKILDIGKDLYKIYLNRDTIPALSLDLFIESELNSLDFKPNIVGVSILFSSSHNSSERIINQVKKRWNDSTIICGGNHATNNVDNLLANPNIDYVLRGEGEISFTESVRKFQKGEKINVLGIIGREKINKNELSQVIENLDEIPIPAYDLLDIEAYKKNVGGSIMFTRGCPFKCTFCSSHTVHGREVRYKSNKRILSELQGLVKKYNFDKIIIEDDLFAINKQKFLELVDKIIEMNLKIKYFLPQGLSVAILNKEIIDAMIKMGIDEASLAIESGSSYTQKNIIKKNVDLLKARFIIEYLREKGFRIYVNFILGFPGEKKELMQETIDFIKTIDVDWVFIFNAIPLRGSEMFQEFVEREIINPHNYDFDGVRLGRRTFDTPEISAEELENLVYDTNIDCNYFNNSNLKHKRYERAIETFDKIIKLYPFHIVGLYCRALAFLGMGRNDEAEKDFKECVLWISKNEESKRLFERYGNKMGCLKAYIEK